MARQNIDVTHFTDIMNRYHLTYEIAYDDVYITVNNDVLPKIPDNISVYNLSEIDNSHYIKLCDIDALNDKHLTDELSRYLDNEKEYFLLHRRLYAIEYMKLFNQYTEE